jgi:hypothetical protein
MRNRKVIVKTIKRNYTSDNISTRTRRLANLIQIQQQQAYASRTRTIWERPANGDTRGIKVHVINPRQGHGNLIHLIVRGTNYVSIHKVTEEIFAVTPDGRKVLGSCGTLSTIDRWDWGGPTPLPARARAKPSPNGAVDPGGDPGDEVEP